MGTVAHVDRILHLVETLAVGVVLNRDGRRRRLARKMVFDLAGLVTPVIYTTHAGMSYFLDTRDRVVSRQTFSAGAFDDTIMVGALALLETLGHPLRGHTFVDVGANLGTSTIPALIRFGARNAIAVEPEPQNYRFLRCNLIANDLEDRVVTICAAASDRSGSGTLQISSRNSGDHRVRPDTAALSSVTCATEQNIEVTLERLDDLLERHISDLQAVGVVWIDCQGHEGYVLKGAPKLMASSVPIICEYWPYGLRRTGNLEMFHQLVAQNYRWVVNIGDTRGLDPVWVAANDVAGLERAYPEQAFTDLILLKHDLTGG